MVEAYQAVHSANWAPQRANSSTDTRLFRNLILPSGLTRNRAATLCSNIDMMGTNADGRFVHKDGTPYPEQALAGVRRLLTVLDSFVLPHFLRRTGAHFAGKCSRR